MNYAHFCCINNAKEHLNQPFIALEHLVATNGEIMIATPNTKKTSEGTQVLQGEWPPLMSFITTLISTASTASFTPIYSSTIATALPEKSECSCCEGKGLAYIAHCGECDGNGELELESDFHTYIVKCKTCDGDGERHFTGKDSANGPIDCERCRGTGQQFNHDDFVMIEGIRIHPKYAELIFSLPDFEVCGDPSQNMLHFKSCDHIGVVMGMRV